MTTAHIALIIGALFTALFGGLMFTFIVVIQRLLNPLSASEYTSTMKRLIKAADVPPVVPIVVIIGMIAPVIALLGMGSDSPAFAPTLIGTILYWVGAFGVTMVLNVPINNAISKTWSIDNPPADWQTMRNRWNRLSWIRTPASVIASILMMIGLTLL